MVSRSSCFFARIFSSFSYNREVTEKEGGNNIWKCTQSQSVLSKKIVIFWIGDHENDTIIFDPGEQAEDIIAAIEENALHPIAIVLTHAHYDHIGAL